MKKIKASLRRLIERGEKLLVLDAVLPHLDGDERRRLCGEEVLHEAVPADQWDGVRKVRLEEGQQVVLSLDALETDHRQETNFNKES